MGRTLRLLSLLRRAAPSAGRGTSTHTTQALRRRQSGPAIACGNRTESVQRPTKRAARVSLPARLRASAGRRRLLARSGVAPVGPAIEHRQHQQGQHGRGQDAADHHRRQRPLHLAPVPVARAIGTKPRDATRAVISTGRRRVMAPSHTAWSRLRPSCNRLRMKEIITRPLSTATPDRAMKPTAAEIDSGIPRSHRASTPPVRAKGMPVNTSRPS